MSQVSFEVMPCAVYIRYIRGYVVVAFLFVSYNNVTFIEVNIKKIMEEKRKKGHVRDNPDIRRFLLLFVLIYMNLALAVQMEHKEKVNEYFFFSHTCYQKD